MAIMRIWIQDSINSQKYESETHFKHYSKQVSNKNSTQDWNQNPKRDSNDYLKQDLNVNSKQDSKEYSTQDAIEYSKLDSNEYSKQDSNKYSKQFSNVHSKQDSKEYSPQDASEYSKQNSNEYSKQDSKEYSKHDSNEYSKQDSNDYSKQDSKEYSKQDWIQSSKHDSNEFLKQDSNEYSKQNSKVYSPQDSNVLSKQDSNVYSKQDSNEYSPQDSNSKLIVMLYHKPKLDPEEVKEMFLECPEVKCEFSHDVAYVNKSSAVIAHKLIQDYTNHVYSLPKRSPGQLWFYFDLESPNYIGMSSKDAEYLTEERKFNATIHYSPSSLIWMSYGKYNGSHIWNYRRIYNMILDKKVDFAAKKDKLLFWAVSNCQAVSKRQNYVKILAKHIQIDIYGKCGTFVCSRNENCETEVFKKYKFYLAFENHICDDYITEKLWKALAIREVVPIVLGGVGHEKYLPPKSYIDIRDFATPADLANYLKKLDEDDELYNEYFAWRYKITPVFDFKQAKTKWPTEYFLCQVCRLIHSQDLNTTYVDFTDRNNDEKYCRNPDEYFKDMKIPLGDVKL
ncbi:unnamed protein product [Owenia fusiformis]|uniref:Fucosyltransferase n=1 Tax=Owenia fusiformis TaxID=6347 RepID=A0A8J1TDV0_OWEFU|nr:unnamed protein product [Owenia fusiformis]